ncbi:MAG: DNA polymerase I, partial [Clostridia bacterium]|nr:DNA polymerase I [Clostridia bacterium]
MKKLLILDSNSIINRAFYGVRYLSAKDGTPTNAIYGFLNILMKLLNEQKYDYICAAFDLKAPTFRHLRYDGYKAQRKPMPEGLVAQMPLSKDILRAMGVTILEKEGYEADDIIGTVARICEEGQIECFIATGDKDDLQLASDKTKVILTVSRQGYNETTVYDDAAVKERYRVTPNEFIDVKALMGDPSDNIPGVKGIGEKTAMSLIEKFHSIEYIYDNIEDVGLKGATLQKMKDGKDMAFLSKELATIFREVPIDFNADDCAWNGFEDKDGELFNILSRLQLNSIIKKMDLTPQSGVSNLVEEDIFEGFSFDEVSSINVNGAVPVIISFEGKEIASIAYADGKKGYVCENASEIKRLLEDGTIGKILFDAKETIVKLN